MLSLPKHVAGMLRGCLAASNMSALCRASSQRGRGQLSGTQRLNFRSRGRGEESLFAAIAACMQNARMQKTVHTLAGIIVLALSACSAPPSGPRPLRFAFIPKAVHIPVFAYARIGAERAAKQLGNIEVIWR